MATGPPSSPHYQPKPRFAHCSALVEHKRITYGGHFGANGWADPPTSVDILNTTTEIWEAVATSGTPPPGVVAAACVAIGHLLYHIGGRDGEQHYYNSIHCLDTRTNVWTEIHPNNPDAAPMMKAGMAIVSHQQTLVTVGGYGDLPTNRHPDVEYVVDPDIEGRGWTNEVVCYDIEHNTWVRPHVTGTPPPACTQCSLTRVNGSCAVMFAGFGKDNKLVPPDVYILDMLHWTWTKIPASQTPGHPMGRYGHSAVSLHDPDGYPSNPALLVMWGVSDGGEVLRDNWIFHLNQRQWRKVILPDILKGRFYHTSSVHHFLPKIKIISFGGLYSVPEDRDVNKAVPIAQTTIVSMSCSGGNPPEWCLTDTHEVGQEELPTHMQVTIEQEKCHLAACERLIREKGKVDMNMALCMMNGPPRVGKSTFLLRITGRPLPQSDGTSETASTGVAERVFQVAIKKSSFTVAMAQAPQTGINWQVITLSQEVAVILRAILSSQPTSESEEVPTSASAERQLLPLLPPGSEECSTEAITTTTEVETNRQPVAMAVPDDTRSRLKVLHMSQRRKLSRTQGYQTYLEVLKKSLRSKEWEIAEQLLKQSLTLYFHDVGGQPEFQEVLPAIIAGPCIFFVVFKLTDQLRQKYRVQYVESLTRKSITYESSFTVLESILQSLASIASMCSYVSRNNGELMPVKPKVVLVGTHKDKAKDKQIRDIQREMKQVLLDTEFYKDNIVVFASPDEPVLTINSLSQDEQDVTTIRQVVERLAKDPAFTVSVPAPWLALLLSFRLQNRAVISYEECTQMANECGIYGDKDIKEALWFLHTKLGVIRYFHQIPELSDIVICDPQVVFDKITDLITHTFKFEHTQNACVSKEFTQKGIFPFEVIDMLSHHSSELLTGSKIVILLKHLRVIAAIHKQPQQSPSHYLVPCVLVHAPDKSIAQKIATFWKGKNHIPSLCITFRCGYCPKGMFGALIAELMNHDSGRLEWNLLDDAIFRDQVSFTVGPEQHVVRISFQVTFLEVHISAITSCARSEQRNNAKHVCSTIRLSLEQSLVNVSTALHYGSGASFRFGFYCTSCSNSKQPAVCDNDDPVVMKCYNCKYVDLKANHRLWFDEKLEPSGGLSINHLETVLTASWEARAKWYNIGLGLKIDPGTLDAINENSSNVEDRFRNMLITWLKMSQPKPTKTLLSEALKSPIVGYEDLAEQLTSLL